MNENNDVVIKQVGYTYIFHVGCFVKPEELKELRAEIKQQLKEGVLMIDERVKLISVEPRLETFVEP